MRKYKEYNDMITQENLTDKKLGEDLLVLKVKQIHYERIEVCTIRFRPLTSYCYIEFYYHDHVIALSPWTTSFLDLLQSQVLPLVTLRLHSKVSDLL